MTYHLFSTGEVLTAANVNNYLMNQTVMVFASAAARTTALSGVLAEGMISYRSDAKVLEIYNGTTWVTESSFVSPLTTKGDVHTYSTTDARLPVGSNAQVLTADSTQATGIKWATPAAGYSAPTIGSTSIGSGATVTTIAGLTLTSPTISTITNTGTVTLPTATDTLVGRATTDTLTNKTLTAPIVTVSVNAQTGTTYTPVLSDAASIVTLNNAASISVTIPTNASVAYAVGTQLNFAWITGAGQPTISAVTSGTTTIISTGATAASPKLRVVNSVATALKIATDIWLVTGDIA